MMVIKSEAMHLIFFTANGKWGNGLDDYYCEFYCCKGKEGTGSLIIFEINNGIVNWIM